MLATNPLPSRWELFSGRCSPSSSIVYSFRSRKEIEKQDATKNYDNYSIETHFNYVFARMNYD